MLIIPAIDLRNGRCVRLAQGRKDAATVYDDNPPEVAKAFENDGARMLHVVDLDGAFSENKLRNREVLRELVSTISIPVQFGGGLRSVADVEQVLALGVTRVVIGTVAAESPDTLARMLQLFGSEALAVGIDAREGEVVTRGWEKQGQINAVNLAKQVGELGITRIVYTDVQRDGMLTGINIDQTCLIAEASGLKITASGGVSSLDDLGKLAARSECGIDSVIVGKAFYEGRFTVSDAQRVAAPPGRG